MKFLQTGLDGPEAVRALSWVERELRIIPTPQNMRMTRALAAIKAGASPEDVAKALDWREFESFCAALFKAKGFEVLENLTTTRPRTQVDLLARSASLTLVVDCKHWRRAMGTSSLATVVARQAKRTNLLRTKLRGLEPAVVVILSMTDEEARYVDGAAVVPIFALGDFLDNLAGYTEGLRRY
jgi:Holliday junction resolvase-like predicted endonuclease